MKRILQFKKTERGYACFEGEENVFEIFEANLQFDVKSFYQAFYSEGKDFEDIEIENCIKNDKTAVHVYGCIINLVQQIKDKLAELSEEDEKESDD